MKVKVHQIADLIKAEVEGNPDEMITHPDKIETAGRGAITFFSNPKYEKYLYSTQAAAVLIDANYQLSKPVPATLLRVENVYLALSELFSFFDQNKPKPAEISNQASIHAGATLGKDAFVGAFTVIEADVSIGDHAQIGSQVYIGAGVHIGDHVRIHPGVKIYHGCQIGDHVVLHANAVIGSDGFGFAQDDKGQYTKIPQIGHVEIGDYVEIGANTVIDRASMGKTILHQGVKLDNLIQIGHNVVIGSNTVIAAQTGISGSTHIGENNQIGGQVGTAGHISIGSNLKIGGGTGIISDIKDGGNYFGTPAMPLKNFMRSYAIFRQLPAMDKDLHQLKKTVAENKKR
ncbi:UDP-3-O-(3-hydroxymyristoyl)glucosamine N-acyltransferase [Membranicola marinus]|uniref:UDP-3-O-acylglucosamine N-acyltransferase n=1 Tax=Membranihabitans marinus TaxID=1227546 RepID=A0A953LCJ9_9BACT|nr:UDP-3-O-(3-hydroxymyristoyl)glucosamine N-acyltransferase [Membranihabitans marinus]MBY5957869.1 UDP-3-O-(3-hydroxymyristoyl)glucosamine N-acyltransferase [Membranihabitans marinus]